VGKEAVRRAYDKVFEELKFHVKFVIAELVVVAPTWAYVRT
jgi:ketosteroid isomerase-like protein